nr:hypothetical protein [Ardenticatena sp.]
MSDGFTFSVLGRSITLLNNWIEPRLAVAYFAWMVVAFIGLMQVAAGRWQRPTWRWLPERWAVPVGALLWGGALLAFFLTNRRWVRAPGPATAETAILLAAAYVVALVLTRLLAWGGTRVR